MHQPFYEDLATGEHVLPWVRMHALKDYWGMVAMLREFPTVRMTFNLVPSLLIQIQAFADNRAYDRQLEVGLRPAEDLDTAARTALIANGFHAPASRMIQPYPRFAELHARRHDPDRFTTADLRDLQVWHKLAWMDPDRLRDDARLQQLIRQQRDFSEDDKQTLHDVELELLRAVIPAYREAATRGQIELSTSPFYHPILPLLCTTEVHRRAHPQSSLPRQLFARPDHAEEQVRRALAFHRDLFGSAPAGVWPSEGSVSDDTVTLLARLGCRWIATDEEVLARSRQERLSARSLYQPYEVGPDGASIRCLFRDHWLSDLVGFVYQSWEAEAAADDFVSKVRDAGQRFNDEAPAGAPEATVAVILDGENAWEHYSDGGRPFLRALYRRLADADDIETVTMSEAAAAPARRLTSLVPGSWINADFYVWAGHEDDHRAWGQLAAACAVFDQRAGGIESEARERAFNELLIAEGSDWFWWYGDDHSSDQDEVFDDLFRRHLRNAYDALGAVVPDELYLSNISTRALPGPMPLRCMASPTINGEVDHFGEWLGARPVALRPAGGTMHQVAHQLVEEMRVAGDGMTIYLRLDGPDLVSRLLSSELQLAVLVERPTRRRLALEPGSSGPRWAARVVVEIALPLDALELAGGRLALRVLVTDRAGRVLEQHPGRHSLDLVLPTRDLDERNWRV